MDKQVKSLINSITRYKNWMSNEALPLWSTRGIENFSGASIERLDNNGSPIFNLDKRTRVQTRQIFTFSIASDFGWIEKDKGQKVCDSLNAFINENAINPEKPFLYVHLLNSSNEIKDNKIDLYDLSFTLLAKAWQKKVFNKKNVIEEADKIIDYICTNLKSKDGGYLEGNYKAQKRRQNPHMHLLEALLSLYEATSKDKYLTLASEIIDLFKNHFFLESKGVLLEYFNDDLSSKEDAQAVEPGHMFEWVWLLDWYSKLSSEDMSSYIIELYNNAYEFGLDNKTGLLYDELDIEGNVINAKKRCWPITEMIKANLIIAKMDKTPVDINIAEDRAINAIDTLFTYFISDNISGSYVDHYNENNELFRDYAPASSMYHFAMALAVCCKYLQL